MHISPKTARTAGCLNSPSSAPTWKSKTKTKQMLGNRVEQTKPHRHEDHRQFDRLPDDQRLYRLRQILQGDRRFGAHHHPDGDGGPLSPLWAAVKSS